MLPEVKRNKVETAKMVYLPVQGGQHLVYKKVFMTAEFTIVVGKRNQHALGVALHQAFVPCVSIRFSLVCRQLMTKPVFAQAKIEFLTVCFQDKFLQRLDILIIIGAFHQRACHSAEQGDVNTEILLNLVVMLFEVPDGITVVGITAAAF